MRTRHAAGIAAALMLGVGGCATGEEWGTWQAHPVHFASGEHMSFSLRNTQGRTPRVARGDITHATSEGWWGKAVTVGQEQILER